MGNPEVAQGLRDAMVDTILLPLSALLCLMPYFIRLFTIWLLQPQASHPCSSQEKESGLNSFCLWVALPF